MPPTPLTVTNCLGKRVLFQHNVANQDHLVMEGRMQVLSPSGKYAYMGGGDWEQVDRLTILELLPEDFSYVPKVAGAPKLAIVQQQQAQTPPADDQNDKAEVGAPSAPASAGGGQTEPDKAAS